MKNKHKNSKKRSQREEHEEINVRIPRMKIKTQRRQTPKRRGERKNSKKKRNGE